MTLEIITRRINEALGLASNTNNQDAVLDCLDTLFIDLIQDDDTFFILKNNFSFFAPPLSPNDSRQFLHVFTDSTMAKEKGSSENLEVIKISSLELLQIAKQSFFENIYGIFLNKQAVISLKRLLIAFNRRVLKDETLVSSSFLDCYSLVSHIRKNKTFKFVCIEDDGVPAMEVDGIKKTYIMNKGEYDLPSSTAIIRPVNLQTIFHMITPIEITTKEISLVIESKNDLLEMLHLLDIEKTSESYIPALDFDNEPAIISNSLKYKEILSLDLCFDRGVNLEEIDDIIPLPEDSPPPEEEIILMNDIDDSDELDREIEPTKTSFFAGFFSLFTRNKEVDAPNENLSLDLEQDDNSASVTIQTDEVELVPNDETVAELDDDNESEEKGGKGLPKLPFKFSTKTLGIIVICIILLILMAIRPVLFKGRNEAIAYRELLQMNDFVSASSQYKQSFDSIITEEVDFTISQYANDTLEAESLASYLLGIQTIQGQEQLIKNAFEEAKLLEASKNAYLLGENSNDLKTKLTYWTAVVPEDSNNYKAVYVQVAENPWDIELIKLIEETSVLDWIESQEYTLLANFYYPDNEEVLRWKYYHDENKSAPPLSLIPVKITNLDVVIESNNSISLYIEWENSGFKTIKQVSFLFSFYNKNGELVYYGDSTYFRGIEKEGGPYEPGYKSKNKNPYPWGWKGIWAGQGNNISKISLEQVLIQYSNGETQAIVNDVDLEEVLK